MKKEKNFKEEIKDAPPVRVDAQETKAADNSSAKKTTADANENTGKAPVKTTFFKDKTQEVADGNGGTVRIKRAVSLESLICIGVIVALFALLASKMGFNNLLNTLFNNAFDLLIYTVLYIMALAVVAGALSAVLSEFGVISLLNRIISPLMKPLYGMPGASVVGIFTCYMSDNPAILTLADDNKFRCYFKKYQLPALCNMGTAFGMGLIVTVFMLGVASDIEHSGVAVLIGNLSAVVGSVISCRIMMIKTKKLYGKEEDAIEGVKPAYDIMSYREVRQGKPFGRLFDALLEGGASGVKVGISVIPGVLIICNLVMILIGGPSAEGYTGAAYEGVGVIDKVGEFLSFILNPLFGFSSPGNVAVPLTALGSAGAATSLVEAFVKTGAAGAGDIAVFTAMCMCWSGYLSTHVSMMDSLKCRHLTGWAIISHTIGGLCAGVAANWIFKLVMLIL